MNLKMPRVAQQAHHVMPVLTNDGAFRYRDYGLLATVGRSRAVAQFGRLHLSGLIAWVLWSVAHIYFLIGFRNRSIVALNWAWSYLTFQRGSRLITGLQSPGLEASQPERVEPRPKVGERLSG